MLCGAAKRKKKKRNLYANPGINKKDLELVERSPHTRKGSQEVSPHNRPCLHKWNPVPGLDLGLPDSSFFLTLPSISLQSLWAPPSEHTGALPVSLTHTITSHWGPGNSLLAGPPIPLLPLLPILQTVAGKSHSKDKPAQPLPYIKLPNSLKATPIPLAQCIRSVWSVPCPISSLISRHLSLTHPFLPTWPPCCFQFLHAAAFSWDVLPPSFRVFSSVTLSESPEHLPSLKKKKPYTNPHSPPRTLALCLLFFSLQNFLLFESYSYLFVYCLPHKNESSRRRGTSTRIMPDKEQVSSIPFFSWSSLKRAFLEIFPNHLHYEILIP